MTGDIAAIINFQRIFTMKNCTVYSVSHYFTFTKTRDYVVYDDHTTRYNTIMEFSVTEKPSVVDLRGRETFFYMAT